MKSLSLMCLLFVAFAVIIDDSVWADKQICMCVPFELGYVEMVQVKTSTHCAPTKTCYFWAYNFYCEVNDSQLPEFEKCCKGFASVQKIWCRDILDIPYSQYVVEKITEAGSEIYRELVVEPDYISLATI